MLFMNKKYTQIRVRTETHDQLAQRGNYNDTFDSIITKLLEDKK